MMRWTRPRILACMLPAAALYVASATASIASATEHPLLGIMQSELDLSMEKLVGAGETKPYFLQHTVTDEQGAGVSASLGALTANDVYHYRTLDVDVRCGDYTLDNTHQIRGAGGSDDYQGWGGIELPLDGDPLATRHAIWLQTDEVFKDAVNRLARVKANIKIKVEEEDLSDDFSREEPSVHVGSWHEAKFDRAVLAEKARKYSRPFRAQPKIFGSTVTISGDVTNRLLINSEGSKLQFGRSWWRIDVDAFTIADDGMELVQSASLDAHTFDGLPGDEEVLKAIDRVIADLLALREAPIVEPYTGPAILLNRASGVFFHEIFGHRIEGHRQKDVEEGQTFAKKIGKQVLPTFLTVIDDPSRARFGDIELNGFYEFDEEAVPSQPVRLVEAGILKTFLLSRSPTRGFTKSNGHGRRESGSAVVARQGNLIIESTNRMSFGKLREMLIEEAGKQGKEYGLLFEDISGGFTMTQRYGPQAFKVLPIKVYRVHTDGRPDELVRGVDIVGTPLTCFSQILCTGDDPDVFNGICGAESGMLPVSAISPSILVEQIEIEKKRKSQDRPPIMDAPIASERAGQADHSS